MEETHNQNQQYYHQPYHHHHHHPREESSAPPEQPTERRIARSTSGKDRHSKVRTAKGLRDRRVRLSAHTAIRFYDVQDRLGFDRPSKAVDWLIRKAGAAISELPPSPPSTSSLDLARVSRQDTLQLGEASTSLAGYSFDQSYLVAAAAAAAATPPPLDSEAMAETMKSFFPIHHHNSTSMSSPPPNLIHNYPSQTLPYNSTSNQVQEDLQLSLQSSHHPITTAAANVDPIALNVNPSTWGEHHNSKMPTWATDPSSLNAMFGHNSYRPLQPTEPWINDSNQIQLSQFGSVGFSNCFHIEEDQHHDLSNKWRKDL